MRTNATEWMPFFGKRFFESERVIAMEPAARMLYLECLWRQWTHGPLPNDEDVLEKMFPEYSGDWELLWPRVRACFELVDGRLVNETLAELRLEADEMIARGRRGAQVANANRRRDPEKADSRASDALAMRSRHASDARAVREREVVTVTETVEPPCCPPSQGGETGGGATPRQRRAERAGELASEVLARDRYAPLRASPAFAKAWAAWVAACSTPGTRSRLPTTALQAERMFDRALAVGPERYAAAIDAALEGDWPRIVVPGKSAHDPPNSGARPTDAAAARYLANMRTSRGVSA